MTPAETNMPGSATQVVFALLHPFLTKDSNHHIRRRMTCDGTRMQQRSFSKRMMTALFPTLKGAARLITTPIDLESLVRKGCSKANTTCVALPGILVSASVVFALCSILLLLRYFLLS